MSLAASLKGLMRRVPQPVSVATVSVSHPVPHFHGATLSSLTSIALAPLPLVAFSIRLPSRLATALNTTSISNPSQGLPLPQSTEEPRIQIEEFKVKPDIVLHYLSSSQTDLASSFAKALPGPPDPSKPSKSTDSPMSPNPFNVHKHTLSAEGIPILQGCVGAISCRVLGSVQLSGSGLQQIGWDQGTLAQPSLLTQGHEPAESQEVSSALYVAEVLRIEDCGVLSSPLPATSTLSSSSASAQSSSPLPSSSPSESPSTAGEASEQNGLISDLPLVYHDQRYVSIGPIKRT